MNDNETNWFILKWLKKTKLKQKDFEIRHISREKYEELKLIKAFEAYIGFDQVKQKYLITLAPMAKEDMCIHEVGHVWYASKILGCSNYLKQKVKNVNRPVGMALNHVEDISVNYRLAKAFQEYYGHMLIRFEKLIQRGIRIQSLGDLLMVIFSLPMYFKHTLQAKDQKRLEKRFNAFTLVSVKNYLDRSKINEKSLIKIQSKLAKMFDIDKDNEDISKHVKFLFNSLSIFKIFQEKDIWNMIYIKYGIKF